MEYLVNKLIVILKKVNYDTLTLIETLDDIYKDIQQSRNKTMFMKFIEVAL